MPRLVMTTSPFNLRVRLYGTQGSGSVFPSRDERRAFEERSHQELLSLVFADLAAHADAGGSLNVRLEDILGGPINATTIAAYAARFVVPEPRVYGGWTTCIWVETADGHDIALDCGSGFRNCARDLQAKWADRPERHLHVFGSHSHLDHTEGFDQAVVCFDPRNHLHVYGNHQFLRALDYHLGIFSRKVAAAAQGVQTPVFFGIMPARFQASMFGPLPADAEKKRSLHHRPLELETPIAVGATSVTAFEVFHPAPCLAYRIEHRGSVFVFCTDHELRRGDSNHADDVRSREAEERLLRYATDADLLYRDGQYLRAEYDGQKGIGSSGPIPRLGWGHSCLEDVVDMALACRIRQTLIGHHDPNRDWSERNRLDESLARRTEGTDSHIELARAETVFDI